MSPPIALVTGAAQRLGRAMSRALAARGYAIAVHYHSSSGAADELVREVRQAGGVAAAFAADLAQPESASGLIHRIAADWGAPVCLVNNASLFSGDRVDSFTIESWQQHMDVNLRAPALLCRAFASALPKEAKGLIVNMLDEAVLRPGPTFFSYTVSKAALAAMTEMLAQVLAPRIRVNAIAPGLVLNSGHPSEGAFRRAHRNTLLGRGPGVDSIVRALEYLVDAEEVTGQVLYVDAGKHLMQSQKYVPKEDRS
jgi:NAD(P)-dependent dehydrogenase (short-subunit alcohol dehydrogenase family)